MASMPALILNMTGMLNGANGISKLDLTRKLD